MKLFQVDILYTGAVAALHPELQIKIGFMLFMFFFMSWATVARAWERLERNRSGEAI